MWYLIIPPLVFILSLWLLLFFLSKRATDPELQQELEGAETEPTRRILFFKEETGLRILERLTQRIKVQTLKMHNTFHSFSQSLRARRELSQQEKREREAEKEASQKEGGRWKNPFRSDETQAGTVHGEVNPAPMAGEPKRSFFSFGRTKKIEASVPPVPPVLGDGLPILRRHVAQPDKPKRLMSEEDLIEKIAKNPKDAVAYEELGDYYMDTKNLEDAKACYRQVIKLSPFNRPVKDKVRKLERLLTQRAR